MASRNLEKVWLILSGAERSDLPTQMVEKEIRMLRELDMLGWMYFISQRCHQRIMLPKIEITYSSLRLSTEVDTDERDTEKIHGGFPSASRVHDRKDC